MKYIFIDTSPFYNSIIGDKCGNILDSFLKKLKTNKEIKLVFPEVIKKEIYSKYDSWTNFSINIIENNINTKKILGISDKTDQNNNQNKYQNKNQNKNQSSEPKIETEAKKIDSVLELGRKQMMESIRAHYSLMSKKIKKILEHKNTITIDLTDNILISGMKRSALKKAPSTRTEKTSERAHLKDLDCIAFESLISFCKNKNAEDKLIICADDQDYFSNDGKSLHEDIKNDIKLKLDHYKSFPELLYKEFGIEITNIEKPEPKIGSLIGNDELTTESSEKLNYT